MRSIKSWVAELVGALGGGDGGHRGQAEGGADLVAGVDDAGGQAAFLGPGRGERGAERRDERQRHAGGGDQRGGQHVDEKLPSGRMNDSQTRPAARTRRPATVSALGPNRAMSRGATVTIPTMIVTVIGSSAAPLAKAP